MNAETFTHTPMGIPKPKRQCVSVERGGEVKGVTVNGEAWVETSPGVWEPPPVSEDKEHQP